jgi:hypothetical protein
MAVDNGEGYLGPAHARCNLSAGGQARAAQLYGQRPSAQDTGLPYKPQDPHARDVWREWRRREEILSDSTWSRHWGDADQYDGRCPRCRELGEGCGRNSRT